MAKDTITLALKGEIPLPLFAKAVMHFDALVRALSEEVAGQNKIEWEISHLEGGSATITAKGITEEVAALNKAIAAYNVVSSSLEQGRDIPFSDLVVHNAKEITRILNGHVTSVVLKTDDYEASINKPVGDEEPETEVGKDYSLGAITGTIVAIWANPLKLGLNETMFGRMVYCYLDKNQQETAREQWGKRVSVTGLIARDKDTGRPISVTQVRDVEPFEGVPARSYKEAKGIIPWQQGDEPSEATIRRIRDAG
jgi:hypothetical protein